MKFQSGSGLYREDIAKKLGFEYTDLKRWRLRLNGIGRYQWTYLSEDSSNRDEMKNYEKYALGFKPIVENIILNDIDNGNYLIDLGYEKNNLNKEKNNTDPLLKGLSFLSSLQTEHGLWTCEYGGPMFLLIGLVTAHYVTNTKLPDPWRIEIIRYLVNFANPNDGGWGLHTEDKSTCFGTCMNYVVLRLCGVPPDNEVMVKARSTLHKFGGALACPHWGKCWLAILNLYSWEGVNPIPPEFWLLPYSLPIHPGRWWCHTRAVYLPLSYLYSEKKQAKLDDLLKDIRLEIYSSPGYYKIDFSKNRNNVCEQDLYYPHTKILDISNYIIDKWQSSKIFKSNYIKKSAIKKVLNLIHYEDINSQYLDIGPVNNVLNAIAVYFSQGIDSENFIKHKERFVDFLYMSPLGMMMMGTNGVQVWDTSFALQSIIDSGYANHPKFKNLILKGYDFLARSQIKDEPIPNSYREGRVGCWPFSTIEQGYTVSDCTAEALKTVLLIQNLPWWNDKYSKITNESLCRAVDTLLSLQNVGNFSFGSFSSYEPIRSTPLLEYLSPVEVFGRVMVEYPYVECTDSTVIGLCYFNKFNDYKNEEINLAIDRGIQFIKNQQNDIDGSWFGSWGVCFTYAHMFACEALGLAKGEYYDNSIVVQKGCDFLVLRQNFDGGWGESIRSCELNYYVPETHSQVVQTSWAVLSLMYAKYPKKDVVKRGIQFIVKKQYESGEWPNEEIEGVFNRSCMIEYPNYKLYFPIKALGIYKKYIK